MRRMTAGPIAGNLAAYALPLAAAFGVWSIIPKRTDTAHSIHA